MQKAHAVLNSFSRKASFLLSFYYVSSENSVIYQLLSLSLSLYPYICEFVKLELKGRIKLSEFSTEVNLTRALNEKQAQGSGLRFLLTYSQLAQHLV